MEAEGLDRTYHGLLLTDYYHKSGEADYRRYDSKEYAEQHSHYGHRIYVGLYVDITRVALAVQYYPVAAFYAVRFGSGFCQLFLCHLPVLCKERDGFLQLLFISELLIVVLVPAVLYLSFALCLFGSELRLSVTQLLFLLIKELPGFLYSVFIFGVLFFALLKIFLIAFQLFSGFCQLFFGITYLFLFFRESLLQVPQCVDQLDHGISGRYQRLSHFVIVLHIAGVLHRRCVIDEVVITVIIDEIERLSHLRKIRINILFHRCKSRPGLRVRRKVEHFFDLIFMFDNILSEILYFFFYLRFFSPFLDQLVYFFSLPPDLCCCLLDMIDVFIAAELLLYQVDHCCSDLEIFFSFFKLFFFFTQLFPALPDL